MSNPAPLPAGTWNRQAVTAFVLTLTGAILWLGFLLLALLIGIIAATTGHTTGGYTDPGYTSNTVHLTSHITTLTATTNYATAYLIGKIIGLTIAFGFIALMIVGIILGHLARRDEKRHLRGRALATAALGIGYPVAALALINTLAGIALSR